MMKLKKNKVVLGLSGGVDSTAAALLLHEKGYEVVGLYFDIASECCSCKERDNSISGRERAEKVASQLGIEFIYKNVADVFDKIVSGVHYIVIIIALCEIIRKVL